MAGCVWHITHRCHKKEFLLKFGRDRRRWLAVGSEAFVTATKEQLGFKVKGREVVENDGGYEPRESSMSYSGHFGPENEVLRTQNGYLWELYDDISI
jgi:hypothetical protein